METLFAWHELAEGSSITSALVACVPRRGKQAPIEFVVTLGEDLKRRVIG